MTLKQMLEAKLAERMDSMSIGDIIALLGETPIEARNKAISTSAADDEPPVRRSSKRGRGRNKVAYMRAVGRGRQRDPKSVAADLPAGNVRLTWHAIVAAKQPISALELEKKTSLGKKAVESAVWALRNAGLVKSQPVSAE